MSGFALNITVETEHSTMMHSAMLFTVGYRPVCHQTNVASEAITSST
jgi:hypothetical protein